MFFICYEGISLRLRAARDTEAGIRCAGHKDYSSINHGGLIRVAPFFVNASID